MYADYSNLTVLESAFLNNVGSDGGAITLWNSSLLVNATTFTNNSAGGTGAFRVQGWGQGLRMLSVRLLVR